MPTLETIIERFRSQDVASDDWLYVSGDFENLSLQSEADIGVPQYEDETDVENDPVGFAERGLGITIDCETVDACIKWADQLSGTRDNEAAADIIRYYVRFDAWPQTLGSPDPPSGEEARRLFAKNFCDALGDERVNVACKQSGCFRGAVRMSVYCRRHHFESVNNQAYPFVD